MGLVMAALELETLSVKLVRAPIRKFKTPSLACDVKHHAPLAISNSALLCASLAIVLVSAAQERQLLTATHATGLRLSQISKMINLAQLPAMIIRSQ